MADGGRRGKAGTADGGGAGMRKILNVRIGAACFGLAMSVTACGAGGHSIKEATVSDIQNSREEQNPQEAAGPLGND